MAIVYQAADPELDRTVAIKFLLGVTDPDARRRFKRQAMAIPANATVDLSVSQSGKSTPLVTPSTTASASGSFSQSDKIPPGKIGTGPATIVACDGSICATAQTTVT